MNFVGHHEVARRAGLEAAGRLGAMLPDFATMLGVRLRRDVLPVDVQHGVLLHHATDAVFHAHERVRSGMHDLAASLAAEDLPRGAARAIGHIGYEMILDSAIDADLGATLRRAGHEVAVEDALGNHRDWAAMRGHLATRVARYDDAEWVARRLFDILRRRPRLAFDAERVHDVGNVLARHAAPIRTTADITFDEVSVAVVLSRG
jgi:hypothetical protein